MGALIAYWNAFIVIDITFIITEAVLTIDNKKNYTDKRRLCNSANYTGMMILRLGTNDQNGTILFMADGLLRSMLLLKKTSMMIWESATLKMSLRMLSTRLEARNSG